MAEVHHGHQDVEPEQHPAVVAPSHGHWDAKVALELQRLALRQQVDAAVALVAAPPPVPPLTSTLCDASFASWTAASQKNYNCCGCDSPACVELATPCRDLHVAEQESPEQLQPAVHYEEPLQRIDHQHRAVRAADMTSKCSYEHGTFQGWEMCPGHTKLAYESGGKVQTPSQCCPGKTTALQ